MSLIAGLAIFGGASIVSLILTGIVRRYAVARSILDRPNDRSLHRQPIPRGGGLAIAATFLGGVLLLAAVGAVSTRVVTALLGGGLLVTTVGWLDDRAGVPPPLRLMAHAAAAVWALAWLGGLDSIHVGDHQIRLGAAGNVLAALGVMWWINLYNFMDGIDGIAGGQAVSVAGAAALLIAWRSPDALGLLPVLLAGAAAGFLVLNWAPARIFMGDAGSGFLGFAFAVLAIVSEHAGALPIVYWLALSAVFIFDSTVTLLRRIAHGERWYSAHRNHAYQRVIALGYSHRTVATAVLIVNAVIFLVIALASFRAVPFAVAAATVLALLTGFYLTIEKAQPMIVSRKPPARDGDAP